jgi:hypothetical protein
MSLHQKALVFLLRLGGTAMGTAFVAVLLPEAAMASIHQAIGLGEFPKAPITDYLSRSLAALYGFHGVLLWIVSMDPRRYAPLIVYAGVMNLVFGSILLVVDVRAGMPSWWTLGEGPPVILIGASILFLLRKSHVEWPRVPTEP